jgi:hypothetical protein
MSNNVPFAANSVVLTLTLANGSAAIDLNQLSNVYFSYGSEQTGVPGGAIHAQSVPEPSTIALALSGLVGAGFAGLRRLRRPQAATV